MKKIFQLVSVSVILITLFSSCSVEKRKYVPGYNVEWKNSNPAAGRNAFVQDNKDGERKITAAGQPAAVPIICGETTTTSADSSTRSSFPISEKANEQINVLPDECDVIIFKNGDEIKAKVSEISQDEIKYKKCEDQNGPTFILKKSEVFMIKYSNGTKDIISQDTPVETNYKPSEKEDNGIFGILSLAAIMSCVLLIAFQTAQAATILLFPAAIVFAIIGLGKNRKGKGFAIATLVVVTAFFLLILAFAGFNGY